MRRSKSGKRQSKILSHQHLRHGKMKIGCQWDKWNNLVRKHLKTVLKIEGDEDIS